MKRTQDRTLSQVGEEGILRRIQEILGPVPEGMLGIGDDAAAVPATPGSLQLLTVDCLREGIHFLRDWQEPKALGWKALAISASDIAAMGGSPRYALLSLAFPARTPLRVVEGLVEGVRDLARVLGLWVVGGNLSRVRGGWSIETTVVGEVAPDQVLRREGARPGDRLYVSGYPGEAAVGLEALKEGRKGSVWNPFRDRFLKPMPRVVLGRRLAEGSWATAALDLSDGLLRDLARLCTASRVGAVVDLSRLPRSSAFRRVAPRLPWSWEQYVLQGGEDYELLFTVDPDRAPGLERVEQDLGIPLTCIGEIRPQKEGIRLVDGKGNLLLPPGFDHFRRLE